MMIKQVLIAMPCGTSRRIQIIAVQIDLLHLTETQKRAVTNLHLMVMRVYLRSGEQTRCLAHKRVAIGAHLTLHNRHRLTHSAAHANLAQNSCVFLAQIDDLRMNNLEPRRSHILSMHGVNVPLGVRASAETLVAHTAAELNVLVGHMRARRRLSRKAHLADGARVERRARVLAQYVLFQVVLIEEALVALLALERLEESLGRLLLVLHRLIFDHQRHLTIVFWQLFITFRWPRSLT